jgi:hypothetical protein
LKIRTVNSHGASLALPTPDGPLMVVLPAPACFPARGSSRLEEPDDGRTRRYFKLTRQGRAAIAATRAEHLRLWQGSRRLLGMRKA